MGNKPIIFIDDDLEDLETMREMASLMYHPTQVMVFDKPHAALDFLKTSDTLPLFILCDINMPKLTGFQLREELLSMREPPFNNVPFILLSTSKTEAEILLADELKIKGFYKKSNSFSGMKETLENIMSSVKTPPGEGQAVVDI